MRQLNEWSTESCWADLDTAANHCQSYWLQVLFSSDCLAIVEGLNNDAPIGTELRFVSGAAG